MLRIDVSDALEDIAIKELDALSLDLVELRRGGSKGRPVLDIRIDRRDGGQVTVDDCAKASRAIEARLDEGALIGDRYVLEVSSPGAERPLRSVADWRRFVGRKAKVNAAALGGRYEVEIVGVDEGMDGADVAVVRDSRGDERRIPLAEIKEARLAFHW